MVIEMIIEYATTVWDTNGLSFSFTSRTENVVVSPLNCCANYSYNIVARTNAGFGTPSQNMSFSTIVDFDCKYSY